MAAAIERKREQLIRKAERELRRWNRQVDWLLASFARGPEKPPNLNYKIEALRNRRDSALTKVEALKRHKTRGWSVAERELDDARSALHVAWRSVIGSLEKENLFV